MHSRTILSAVAMAAALAGAAGGVFAHGGATGIVGDRMNGMMDMARSVKALSELLGGDAIDPEAVDQAAAVIEGHAGETMLDLFPEGSIEGPSDASPDIWTDWQKFAELADRLKDLASELRTAPIRVDTPPEIAETGDEVSPVLNPNIWASLDERDLLGLKSLQRIEPIGAPPSPMPRTQGEVFSLITDTCASCHQQFRQAKP